MSDSKWLRAKEYPEEVPEIGFKLSSEERERAILRTVAYFKQSPGIIRDEYQSQETTLEISLDPDLIKGCEGLLDKFNLPRESLIPFTLKFMEEATGEFFKAHVTKLERLWK